MSKTPPLVIPVVIDGRGVDRGLNNINSRLRRGVGGGGSGVGGDTGTFGSGGVAAGAIAAAIVSGGLFGGGSGILRSGGKRYTAAERRNYYGRPFQPQQRPGFGQGGGGVWGSYHESLIRDSMANPNNRAARVKREDAEADFNDARRKNLRSARLAHDKGQLRAYDKSFSGARWGGHARDALHGLGGGTTRSLAMRSFMGGGVIGAAAIAAGRAAVNLPSNIKAMDMTHLQGSRNWGVLRKMQLRAQDGPKHMSMFESFMFGAQEVAGGGRETSTERFGQNAERLWSGFWMEQGKRFEYGLRAIDDVRNTILGRQLSN